MKYSSIEEQKEKKKQKLAFFFGSNKENSNGLWDVGQRLFRFPSHFKKIWIRKRRKLPKKNPQKKKTDFRIQTSSLQSRSLSLSLRPSCHGRRPLPRAPIRLRIGSVPSRLFLSKPPTFPLHAAPLHWRRRAVEPPRPSRSRGGSTAVMDVPPGVARRRRRGHVGSSHKGRLEAGASRGLGALLAHPEGSLHRHHKRCRCGVQEEPPHFTAQKICGI